MRRTAVSISWRVHHEAAVAADREDAPLGMEHRGHHRRGQAGAHRRQRIVEQQRVGDAGAVVAGEPDLVHAVVERDDAVLRHHLADVVHDALRRRREARSSVARSVMRARISSRSGSSAAGVRQLALEPVGQQFQARPDVADHLGMREVDLLDVGRRVADVDHLRPVRPHDERRLLDRVVADRDDQVGLVDRLVDVVALGQRGRAHVEVGAARPPCPCPSAW